MQAATAVNTLLADIGALFYEPRHQLSAAVGDSQQQRRAAVGRSARLHAGAAFLHQKLCHRIMAAADRLQYA